MSIKNPYSTRVPLVALESIHTQRPYLLIAMDFIKISPLLDVKKKESQKLKNFRLSNYG